VIAPQTSEELSPPVLARRLALSSAVAALFSATLLALNYRYVSLTVDLDDYANPYLAWHAWSTLALLVGGLLGLVAMLLAVVGATLKRASMAVRLTSLALLCANVVVLYLRYKIRP
jgi:hypothetical protein